MLCLASPFTLANERINMENCTKWAEKDKDVIYWWNKKSDNLIELIEESTNCLKFNTNKHIVEAIGCTAKDAPSLEKWIDKSKQRLTSLESTKEKQYKRTERQIDGYTGVDKKYRDRDRQRTGRLLGNKCAKMYEHSVINSSLGQVITTSNKINSDIETARLDKIKAEQAAALKRKQQKEAEVAAQRKRQRDELVATFDTLDAKFKAGNIADSEVFTLDKTIKSLNHLDGGNAWHNPQIEHAIAAIHDKQRQQAIADKQRAYEAVDMSRYAIFNVAVGMSITNKAVKEICTPELYISVGQLGYEDFASFQCSGSKKGSKILIAADPETKKVTLVRRRIIIPPNEIDLVGDKFASAVKHYGKPDIHSKGSYAIYGQGCVQVDNSISLGDKHNHNSGRGMCIDNGFCLRGSCGSTSNDGNLFIRMIATDWPKARQADVALQKIAKEAAQKRKNEAGLNF